MTAARPVPAADGAAFAWPRRALAHGLIRSAAGLALTLGPLALAGAGGAAGWVLGALASVFALYGAQTLLRAGRLVAVTREGLETRGPAGGRLAWDAVTRVRLSYYAARRGGADGWMVLTVTGAGRTMRVDSTLDGFAALAARVAGEARARGIALSPATRGNLTAAGIDPDAPAR